jgi:hypothetical protein
MAEGKCRAFNAQFRAFEPARAFADRKFVVSILDFEKSLQYNEYHKESWRCK